MTFKRNMLTKFFSIKNEGSFPHKHKILTIFGLKIKFKIKENLKKYFKKAVKNSYYSNTQKHKKVILQLQQKLKTQKLRVCFWVSETQKWNSQKLYDLMLESDSFEPFILIAPQTKKYPTPLNETLSFFKKLCKNIEIGYDEATNESIDIKKFNPDIIFYQQPWGIPDNQSVEHVLDFALPYYIPYSISNTPYGLKTPMEYFYLGLRKHFVFNSAVEKQYKKIYGYSNKHNIVVTGHPKLDTYKNYQENNNEKKYVIFAPHHSLDSIHLQYGTFRWSGKYILDWAKAHPEFNWVFKPHPVLKTALIDNEIMTEEEMETYFKEWAKLGLYYDKGEYFDIFKNSKCLITDCGSFLSEYLPTRQPVIHLRNKKARAYSASNLQVINSYYKAWNKEDLDKHLTNILIRQIDIKKKDRLNIINKINFNNFNATENIINEVLKDLK